MNSLTTNINHGDVQIFIDESGLGNSGCYQTSAENVLVGGRVSFGGDFINAMQKVAGRIDKCELVGFETLFDAGIAP